ncbi:hypothetical protein ACFQY4_17345 [Catellatospora bangladeshensis]|nr:hypothetical protein [Catellatospora bangladeshensis]
MLMIYGEGVVGILDADVTDDEVMAEFRIEEVVRVPPIRLLT